MSGNRTFAEIEASGERTKVNDARQEAEAEA